MVSPVDQTDREWEQLIADEGKEVSPDTYMKTGTTLTTREEVQQQGWAQKVNSLEFKGYVQVWDTRTGVESLQPRWLLWQTMNKRRADGSRVFTTTDPKIPQPHGDNLMCPLHPDHPDFLNKYRHRGFRECPGRKNHIPHREALESHIRHSHKRLHEAREREREEERREEDRQLQKDVLAAIGGAAARGVQVEDSRQAATSKPQDKTAACEDCGKEFSASTVKQAQHKVRLHQRRCKAQGYIPSTGSGQALSGVEGGENA